MCIHRCYYDELSFGSLGTQEVTQVETNIWAWLDLQSIKRFQKNGIFKAIFVGASFGKHSAFKWVNIGNWNQKTYFENPQK